tara:strand:+ start:1689 stop:5318 length:3630 start_codon:yes stop_codon:yes gene_type:complete
MSNIPNQRLEELMAIRPTPKAFRGIKIQINNKPAVENSSTGITVAENIEDVERDMEDVEETALEIPQIQREYKAPIIFDKRKSSMVDRLAILARMAKNTSSIVFDETVDTPEKIVARDPMQVIPVLTGKKINPKQAANRELDQSRLLISEDIGADDEDIGADDEDIGADDEDIGVVNAPKPKARKLKIKGKVIEETIDDVDLTTAVIRTQKIFERLPKEREKVIIKAPSYYMNNRKKFIQNMTEVFSQLVYAPGVGTEYFTGKEDIENSQGKEPTASKEDFKLLMHQKIVRDYLNLYTPYRGLLLYHGLGSGKTCTSIAIAEGMKSDKRICIMTPASLKMNFFSELKKCGDDLYKKNQFWEFISTAGNPSYVGILSRALSLPPSYITDHTGAWLVNINNEPNFAQLTTGEQKAVDEQLNAMIRNKYSDINYNAPNIEKQIEILATKNNTKNPFDNCVVIIDEAHNFVSRIVNKIKVKDSISYKLYEYLLSATNAKIVLLTGTPIINYPNEIGILYNILRGYIKTWTIPVSWEKTEKLNEDAIYNMLDDANIKTYDYINFTDNKLTITRNPHGFINTKKRGRVPLTGTRKEHPKPKKGGNKTTRKVHGGTADAFTKYNGVKLDDSGNIGDAQFLESIIRVLKSKKNNVSVKETMITEINHKALPDIREDFFDRFVDVDKGETKNINLFQRRILGLTSYFRSAKEDLLPELEETDEGDVYHVVKTPMTSHQFGIYEQIRKEEADREKKSATNRRMNKADELYKVSSTYRIFSRAACNFTFPESIQRPVPDKRIISTEGEDEDDINEDVVDNISSGQITVDNTGKPPEEGVEINSSYARRIEIAMEEVSRKVEGTNISQYLSKDALPEYSPKFAKVLENLMEPTNVGLHLLYSHFRTMEGIGLMRLILLANGMAEFKIKHEGDSWTLDIAEEDMEKPKFVLYTGTESADVKEIIRNIYNGNWELVPSGIVTELRKISENNMYGEIIKTLMITASGAEGINLRNTRYVHIVEPYWHMVRTEQVVGRARRIGSHVDLPEELRTVKVFLYVSTLSQEQKTDGKNVELRIRDVSRIDKKTPVTTDETLYEISSIKQRINNEILRAVKETAVDCNIHSTSNGDKGEDYVCYGSGMVDSNNFSSHPTLDKDSKIKDGLDMKTISWKGVRKNINGVDYAMNPKTRQLYNLDSFRRAQKMEGDLIYVGKYEIHNGVDKIV